MATIVYLHGFASAGVGSKVDALKAAFINHDVVCPNLPFNPDAVIATLDGIVKAAKSFPIVFVGTSLGGFWANFAAHRWDCLCVIVNPSATPSKTMYERVGPAIKNWATGEDIVVTMNDVARFATLEDTVADTYCGALVHLIVAKDDDVIDYRDALDFFKYTASCTVFDTGGHRFEKNWDFVIEKVRSLISE